MSVSGQEQQERPVEKGPRGRMKRLMLDTALRLMQDGGSPSVSDVAEAAQVSRATAYRYFPSQAAMIQAAVDDALGPVLDWKPADGDAATNVAALFSFAFRRMEAYEATHRAALLLALDQWQRRRAGTLGAEARVVRGNRRGLLKAAVAPLDAEIGHEAAERVTQALSLVFGIEAIVILKDIWGLDAKGAEAVASWAASALIRQALLEAREGETRADTEVLDPGKGERKTHKKGA
ncbi:transcriptional regulator, TetR family [Kaistia soli DSM 19436]|uniref:Transcriptional regulator, TetR family n=1 Tax=Kaistia soli DSM 19436 TaxID=1122133 RepID=A0A1M4XH12_9HYPH|nr:TetR/AcrR family transcriptional regulator [Kaistia soli]SHE92785.1 transcriptional regulator, TetR family [Kaistia soli DSM 19436]